MPGRVVLLILPGGSVPLEELCFDCAQEGGIVFQGTIGFALAGVFAPHDTEYVRTDGGVFIWDNFKFRGLGGVGQRVRAVKKGGDIVIEAITT